MFSFAYGLIWHGFEFWSITIYTIMFIQINSSCPNVLVLLCIYQPCLVLIVPSEMVPIDSYDKLKSSLCFHFFLLYRSWMKFGANLFDKNIEEGLGLNINLLNPGHYIHHTFLLVFCICQIYIAWWLGIKVKHETT